jgi:hypothetical protein
VRTFWRGQAISNNLCIFSLLICLDIFPRCLAIFPNANVPSHVKVFESGPFIHPLRTEKGRMESRPWTEERKNDARERSSGTRTEKPKDEKTREGRGEGEEE